MNTVTRSSAAVVAIIAAVLVGLALLVPVAHMLSSGHGAPAVVSVADGGTSGPTNEDWG